MKDSVIYQDILEQGLEQGLQQGSQAGEAKLVLRLLKYRFGTLAPDVETQIRSLSVDQLEALGEALLDFTEAQSVNAWLLDINS